VIEAQGLVKRYGSRLAVDQLSFTVAPGCVTGFLGPNGSGKSTTMRLLLGLDRPQAGTATFDGKPYRSYARPLAEVGALLDAAYVHPTRTAAAHLWGLAASNGLPRTRVDEVLAMVGLAEVGGKRVGAYSLGMKQRLGIAAAMLGDPRTLLFDEPANGLDPEGVRWIREFMGYLAREGRTVFVSSHQLAEMSLMADRLIVIGRGRLITEASVEEFVKQFGRSWVRVVSPNLAGLSQQLQAWGARLDFVGPTEAHVYGPSATDIGELAARAGIVLHQLADQTGSLEDAYLEVTNRDVEFRAGAHGA
jgi:ABC-2 type transport system ATP-binding protein